MTAFLHAAWQDGTPGRNKDMQVCIPPPFRQGWLQPQLPLYTLTMHGDMPRKHPRPWTAHVYLQSQGAGVPLKPP